MCNFLDNFITFNFFFPRFYMINQTKKNLNFFQFFSLSSTSFMSSNGGIVFLKMFLVYRSRRTLIRYHNFTFFCQQHIRGHLISEGWTIVMGHKK